MPTQNEGSGRPDRTLSHSSLAQSVEPAAVNRVVVGSSPTGGAKRKRLAAMKCRQAALFKKSCIGKWAFSSVG